MHYDYILYVDESGDPGLRTVRPIDPNGASEWMTLSGVLVKASREQEMIEKITTLRSNLSGLKKPGIHFANLSPAKRLIVSSTLATWPVRCFVVCSNKRNMRGRQDAKPQAQIVEVKSWFYAWLFRLLIERVSKWAYWKSMNELGRPAIIKIELSQRGGIRYIGMRAYLAWLKTTFASGVGALPQGTIKWETIDIAQVRDFPHETRAGLQMADWVASGFFKAIDKHQTGGADPQYAKAMMPVMAFLPPSQQRSGFGVKLMPTLSKAKSLGVEDDQLKIFYDYGYPGEWRE